MIAMQKQIQLIKEMCRIKEEAEKELKMMRRQERNEKKTKVVEVVVDHVADSIMEDESDDKS